MIRRLQFAFSYAFRNMLRDRQRAAFTILSVCVGIATVVALRALGLMIGDALTTNAQAFLRGDVRAIGPASISINLLDLGGDDSPFTANNMPAITEWAEERGYALTFVTNSELMQAAVVEDGRAGTPALTLGYFIDPDVYPFYDIIRAEEPAGVLLAELFSGPNQVVLGRRLAEQIGASVGDVIRIGAADNLHAVTGIVPDSAETTFEGPQSLFFSFVYLDRAELPDFGLPVAADRAYLKLPPGTDQAAVEREAGTDWRQFSPRGTRLRITTANETMLENQQIADLLSRFVMILSLVGLVIGGVGILNTMLVAVNRRAGEIAVLKTLGLQGDDISLVFVAEAILAGLAGSVLGVGLGFGLSYVARNLGQQIFAVALPWRLYLDPLLLGLGLGVTATVFFSFLPTITAARIRPNLVLRQEPGGLVRAGKRWTLLSLALLIIGFGLLIDLIIGDLFFINVPGILTPGIVFTLGVFIVIMFMLLMSWVLVWLMGRLPAFRNPNLQIAIRGLTLHRSRTALAMLSLVVGMVALSGTLIMARSISLLLYTSVSQPLGGNVIILPLPVMQETVHNRLDALEGVRAYRDIRFSTTTSLRAINGDRQYNDWFDYDDPQSAMRSVQLEGLMGVRVHGEPQRGTLVAGRYLTAEDAGQPLITIPYLPEWDVYGVGVGSTFTYFERNGGQRTYEVVGVVAPPPDAGLIPFSLNDSAVQAPLEMVPSGVPFDLTIVDARPDAVNEVMAAVAAVPGVFVFDISLFDSMLNRLAEQMAALPLLVAVLSLFASAALIATTVALATMERQRQIAMLKAIGVSRWQVLGQLLVENGIVGVVGGLLSLAPTLLILGLIPTLTMGVIRLPVPWDLVALMLALAILVTIGATLVTAWGASGEKPLVALRHE